MERTCARAVELGLPSVAFTEHADFEPLVVPPEAVLPDYWLHLVSGGVLTPPALDVDGYLACLERCRERYPHLRIHSGVELSEPHWDAERTDLLLDHGSFDRVLGSVHAGVLGDGSGRTEIGVLFARQPAEQVVRDYLAEVERMVVGYPGFDVLAHIDYAVRYWPGQAAPYNPRDFQDDYRGVLSALAAAGKVLEVNTRVPLHLDVIRWWHDEGGESITFASDAHEPDDLAAGLTDAIGLAEAAGFRAGQDPWDHWFRT